MFAILFTVCVWHTRQDSYCRRRGAQGLRRFFAPFIVCWLSRVVTVTFQRQRLWRGPVVALAVAFALVAISIYRGHQRKQQSEATEIDNQHWKKATALRAQGKHSEAVSEYEQALSSLAYNSILRQELAYELQVLGRDDEAAAQLREVLSIDRERNGDGIDSEVHIDLGRILEGKAKTRDALKEYCLAADISPDVYFYHVEAQRLSKLLNLSSNECPKHLSREDDDAPFIRDGL